MNADLKAGVTGSKCHPLADGAHCAEGVTCSKGLCGGAARGRAGARGGTKQLPCGRGAQGRVVTAAGARSQRWALRRCAARALPQPPFAAAARRPPSPLAGEEAWAQLQADDAAAVADAEAEADAAAAAADAAPPGAIGEHAPPAPDTAVPTWGTFTATLHADARIIRVPATFLATSHEWDRITDYADNIRAFAEIFKEFGPSPILRMGGASQDFLTEPPKKEIWCAATVGGPGQRWARDGRRRRWAPLDCRRTRAGRPRVPPDHGHITSSFLPPRPATPPPREALAKMQKAFNARFLIGLPLWKPDSVHLARRMMELTEQYLPKEAILGYELGNEVWAWGEGA
jgi:hypothetical protein